MIKLILGGSGTGKTHRIREMIMNDAKEGIQSVLIVPEQETVSAERRMLDILPPSAQLTFEVTNFTRLANRVFRVYGGLTYEYISAGAKSLAMWNTLRELSSHLSVYDSQTDDLSFVPVMMSAAEEFKAYRVTPDLLEKASGSAEDGSRMKKKLCDLAFIYGAYQASISEYGDGSDDIGKLASVLKKHDFFDGFRVYIDSFTSFTSAELAVISHIASQADALTVSLCLADHGGLQFEVIEQSIRKLERMAEKIGCGIEKEMLTENKRTRDPELCRIERDIWSFGASSDAETECSGAVELIKCTNIYEEAEAAASKVSELVRGGMRYRDIVILARDIASYEGIIDDALEKADIPFFMSRSRDVTTMPLSKLLLCALRIIGDSWQGEDVVTYLKTGLCGLDDRETDLLEEYIWRWNINGKAFLGGDWTMHPYSYSGDLDDHSKEVLETVNEARRKITSALTALSDAFGAAKNNTELCHAMFEYMQSLSVADTLSKRAEKAEKAGEREEACEILQLYNTVLDSLSIIAEFYGEDEKFEVREFEDALHIVLSQASVGSIPTSCDEVTVGSASMLRADEPRAVIVIGMNDGVFPSNVSESAIFSDEEKKFLEECGLELSPCTTEKSSEELFYVYRAFSAPSEKLILTYAASELQGGAERLPSVAFSRASLITGEKVTAYTSVTFDEKIPSEKIAFEYAALFGDKPEGRALRRYFNEKKEYASFIERLAMPLYETECLVSEDVTNLIFGDHMLFSPSALERYIKCHFGYYCEKILKLRPSEKNVMKTSDTGTLIHSLLENFIKRVTGANGFDAARAEEECEKLIDKLIEIYADENFPEKDRKKKKTEYFLKKLRGLSVLIAKNVTKELSSSRFVPTFFELRINEHGGKDCAVGPVFEIDEDKKKVCLHGFVDRVDLLREGNDVYVKVIDYKTGSKTFSLEKLKDGLDAQMLLYLFALCGEDNRALLGCGDDGKVIPAGVVYLSSKIEDVKKSSGTAASAIISEADGKLNRSGLLLNDEHIIEAQNKDCETRYVLSSMSKRGGNAFLKTSGEFDTIRNELKDTLTDILTELRHGNACICPKESPCEYCDMRHVCRSAHLDNDETEGNN